jgi:eukaryotic-like serine/threonine-protein kinase
MAEDLAALALSPDERWLAGQRLDLTTGTAQVWLYDVKRGVTVRLTDGQSNTSPVWAADSASVIYAALRNGERLIETQRVNEAPRPEVLARFGIDNVAVPESVTADGHFLSFRRTDPHTNADVWILPLVGNRRPFPFVQTAAAEMQSRLSPDGRWLAYTSNASGTWQVYLQPFPATGEQWQISVDGGGDPQWRGDGQELFFLRPDRMLMAVRIRVTPGFEPATPTPLFLTHTTDLVGVRNHYVATRDGQRFLFEPISEDTTTPITLVVNWSEELKQRVPTR